MVEEYGEGWPNKPYDEGEMHIFLDLYGARTHGRVPILHSLVTDDDINASQSSRSSVTGKAPARSSFPGYVSQEQFDEQGKVLKTLSAKYEAQAKLIKRLSAAVFQKGGTGDDDDDDGGEDDDEDDGDDEEAANIAD
jgi:hypothetical protein